MKASFVTISMAAGSLCLYLSYLLLLDGEILIKMKARVRLLEGLLFNLTLRVNDIFALFGERFDS
jgi:hypothetical protein